MAPNKIIIDTDPGADDAFALLLALASSPEEVELALVSVTYGNVPLDACLRNAVAVFHVLHLEMEWRRAQGRPLGFENLRTHRPVLAAGPEHALEEELLKADNFRESQSLLAPRSLHGGELLGQVKERRLFFDTQPGGSSWVLTRARPRLHGTRRDLTEHFFFAQMAPTDCMVCMKK